MSSEESAPFSPEAFPSQKAGGSASDASSEIDQILDGIGEGFFALDSNWRFTVFNRAAEEAFDLKRKDALGKLIWEIFPAVVGSEFERRYRSAMEDRVQQLFEAPSTRRPDRFREVRAFPLGAGIGVAFRDASERRTIASRLQEREQELKRVQKVGGIGGIRIDIRGGLSGEKSLEYRRLHGLPPDAAVEPHEDWERRLHPEDRAEAVDRLNEAIRSGATAYASEYRIIQPSDGAVRWIRAVGEIERDANGEAVALVGAHSDITERKLAEQEAHDSEERLLAIADALPVLISYVDKDQIFRFVNKAYESWFERPRSEIVGRRVADVMTPSMYEARRPYLERALSGEPLSYEVEFERSSGAIVTEVTHVPHRDASGGVLGVHVVVSDITSRVLAERKVAESEARFRAIANSAPVLIWVTGADGTREFVNEAYLNFAGWSYDEALRADWHVLLHPEDLPRILQEEPLIAPSLKSVTVEARFRRADGEWRWMRAESQPRWGPKGEHQGFIGVAHDVTEAKDAEAALTRLNETLERRVAERTAELAASEALVATILNHSPEKHALLVEDGEVFRYQEANPSALELFGLPREAVIGRTVEEVLGTKGGAVVVGHLRACLEEGRPRRYERMYDDALVEATVTAVPGREGEPRRVVISARDMTERRRLEEQLRQAQKMEALGQLTGGVAHDFNNMLTLMLGGLDTIDRQLAQLPASAAKARIERAKDLALQGVQRARALTGRLLAFSRRQALAPQSVDANSLVGGICDLLQRTLGERIALKTILADGIWNAFVDPNQLENALINLALNARDAMPEGGRLVIETANHRLASADVASLPEPVEPGDFVMIAVMDTGAGMDAATVARAFDPFFTTKEIGKGTGLGLSQVYGFTRQSGGCVEIESAPGRGAAVRLYLPRQAHSFDMKDPAPADLSRPGGRESILVVEDDDGVRAYATEALRELGYRVAEAPSGKAALGVLDSVPRLDLLLTDVIMPGEYNGRELADEAVKRRPGLRVLFMTGYSRDAILRNGRLAPGVHVIGKPFSLEELAGKVRSRLDAGE